MAGLLGVTLASPWSPATKREPGRSSCGSRGSRSSPYLFSNARSWGSKVILSGKQDRRNRMNRVKREVHFHARSARRTLFDCLAYIVSRKRFVGWAHSAVLGSLLKLDPLSDGTLAKLLP